MRKIKIHSRVLILLSLTIALSPSFAQAALPGGIGLNYNTFTGAVGIVALFLGVRWLINYSLQRSGSAGEPIGFAGRILGGAGGLALRGAGAALGKTFEGIRWVGGKTLQGLRKIGELRSLQRNIDRNRQAGIFSRLKNSELAKRASESVIEGVQTAKSWIKNGAQGGINTFRGMMRSVKARIQQARASTIQSQESLQQEKGGLAEEATILTDIENLEQDIIRLESRLTQFLNDKNLLAAAQQDPEINGLIIEAKREINELKGILAESQSLEKAEKDIIKSEQASNQAESQRLKAEAGVESNVINQVVAPLEQGKFKNAKEATELLERLEAIFAKLQTAEEQNQKAETQKSRIEAERQSISQKTDNLLRAYTTLKQKLERITAVIEAKSKEVDTRFAPA